MIKNDNFRIGYRDALMGFDFIRDDMLPAYYDGVAKAMMEIETADDWNSENLTFL